MSEKKEASNIRKGAEVGAGFFVGYALARLMMWGLKILILVTIVTSVSICVCNQKRKELEELNAAKKELAAFTGNKTPKKNFKPYVTFHKVCNVRAAPSLKAKIIGSTNLKEEYIVRDKKGKWRKIVFGMLQGYVGCKPRRK